MAFLHKRVGVTPGGFGEALYELREQRGYTLEDVSRASGIHVSIIQALEEERIGDLLDPYYEERHVRTLVAFLEGQPAYFLEKYHALLAASGAKRESDVLLRPRVRARELFVSSRFLAFGGFLLLALLLAGYVAWQAVGLSSTPQLIVFAPQDGAKLEEPRVVISGATDPAAFVSVNGERAVVDPDGKFKLVFDVPRGVTTIKIEAKRRYGSSTVVERHIMFEREAIPPDSSSPTSSATSTD